MPTTRSPSSHLQRRHHRQTDLAARHSTPDHGPSPLPRSAVIKTAGNTPPLKTSTSYARSKLSPLLQRRRHDDSDANDTVTITIPSLTTTSLKSPPSHKPAPPMSRWRGSTHATGLDHLGRPRCQRHRHHHSRLQRRHRMVRWHQRLRSRCRAHSANRRTDHGRLLHYLDRR